MKEIELFESWKALNEIGEGGRPFPWKRVGVTKLESWISTLSEEENQKAVSGKWEQLPSILYSFSSEKGTYRVTIAGGWQKLLGLLLFRKPGAPDPPKFGLIIVVAFDIEGREGTPITNFGEQFRVLSTVTEIALQLVNEIDEYKWIELQEIRIAPKLEDEEEGSPITQSKRGRLYLEYIKKQGRKLPGNWTAEISGEMFHIRRGRISSSTHPESYIPL